MAPVHLSIRRWKLQSLMAVWTAILLVLAGCKGGSPTEPVEDPVDNSPGTLTVSLFATQPLLSGPSAGEFATSGVANPALAVSRARFLLRGIGIHPVSGEWIELSDSPMVVGLHLGGALTPLATIQLPVGNYDQVRIGVHRLDPADSLDQTVLVLPDFTDFNVPLRPSMILDGTIDTGSGPQPFLFRSDDEGAQTLTLPGSFHVGGGQSVNVTIRIDQNAWFDDGVGGTLDPREHHLEPLISSNLFASIEAFRDQDQNGHAD
jgi:hypothetical protein